MTVTAAWRLLLLALALPLGCGSAGIAARRTTGAPPAPQASTTAAGHSAPEAGARRAGDLPRKPPPAAAAPVEQPARVAIETATALVGKRNVTVNGVDWGPGCTALVRASLARAGHPLPPEVKDAPHLHAFASRSGALRSGRRVEPGDVIFLADRPGGEVAHAGLVARAEPDGTAVVLHRVARGVARLRLNLAWPQRTNDPATGRKVNDTLYVGQKPVPAGSLVVGVADLLR